MAMLDNAFCIGLLEGTWPTQEFLVTNLEQLGAGAFPSFWEMWGYDTGFYWIHLRNMEVS